jgi:hypothetical protein
MGINPTICHDDRRQAHHLHTVTSLTDVLAQAGFVFRFARDLISVFPSTVCTFVWVVVAHVKGCRASSWYG